MSESLQKMMLVFACAMVAMIALLLALQIGFGQLADSEPQMVNPQSLLVAAIVAALATAVFGPGLGGRDEN